MGARCEHLQLAGFPPSPSLEAFCKNASALPEHWWLVETSLLQGCQILECSALLPAALTDANHVAGAVLPAWSHSPKDCQDLAAGQCFARCPKPSMALESPLCLGPACDTEPGCHLVPVAQAEQGLGCESRLASAWAAGPAALPGLLVPAALPLKAEGEAGHVSSWLLDSVASLFARKPKWICRFQRKCHLSHYWAAFCSCSTPQLYSPAGIYCSFSIWCFNPQFPCWFPFQSCCSHLGLPCLCLWSETLASLRSSFTCPLLLSAKGEKLLWKHSKWKYSHRVAQVLPFPPCSCEPDIKHLSWHAGALGFSGDTKTWVGVGIVSVLAPRPLQDNSLQSEIRKENVHIGIAVACTEPGQSLCCLHV